MKDGQVQRLTGGDRTNRVAELFETKVPAFFSDQLTFGNAKKK